MRDADRVADRHLVDAEIDQLPRELPHPPRIDGAVERAPERRGQVAADAHPGGARLGADLRERRQRLRDRAVGVALAEPLGGRREDRDLAHAGRHRLAQAGEVRDQGGVARARGPCRAPASAGASAAKTSRASASCGTRSGRTNDVTSTTGRPAAASRSTKATLSAVAIRAASFCRPSRGPTSTIVTRFVMTSTSGSVARWTGSLVERPDRHVRIALGIQSGYDFHRPAADLAVLDVVLRGAAADVDPDGQRLAARRTADFDFHASSLSRPAAGVCR